MLRKLLGRLGPLTRSLGERRAFVLGLDQDGKVVANLQYGGADAYAPMEREEAVKHEPTVVLLGPGNVLKSVTMGVKGGPFDAQLKQA